MAEQGQPHQAEIGRAAFREREHQQLEELADRLDRQGGEIEQDEQDRQLPPGRSKQEILQPQLDHGDQRDDKVGRQAQAPERRLPKNGRRRGLVVARRDQGVHDEAFREAAQDDDAEVKRACRSCIELGPRLDIPGSGLHGASAIFMTQTAKADTLSSANVGRGAARR
ncbi:hypothetical protein D3C73_1259250 [compost metagenome]